MKIYSLVLSAVLFLTISADAQNEAKWLTYQDDAYTMQYPNDWQLDQSGTMGAKIILFAPQTSATDQFRENVNLMEQDLSAYDLDLDDFVALSENQVKTAIKNGNLLLSERIKTKKGEYHKLVYSGDMGSQQLKFEQYFWVMGDTAIVLTYTGEINVFATFQDTAERIMNSLKIK